jgi:hypothetical protein
MVVAGHVDQGGQERGQVRILQDLFQVHGCVGHVVLP